MSKNIWAIIYVDEGMADMRPEILFVSLSLTKIIEKLREIKEAQDENLILSYVEDDCLILNDNRNWYIEKAIEVL